MKIILASTSPFRRKQLEELNIQFTALPPQFDEDTEKLKHEDLHKLCLLLGQKKAESLISEFPNCMIIGSDQMLVMGDQFFNKPNSLPEVIERLTHLNGKTHTLLTSLFIYTSQKTYSHLDETHLTMKNLSPEQIKEYAELDQPIGCAGGYKYEKNGSHLFKSIQSQDPSSIVGLPTKALTSILKDIGI